MKKSPISITLEPEIIEKLDAIAKSRYRSRASQAKAFIIDGISREESKSNRGGVSIQ